MANLHIIPTRESKKSGVRFALGRVRHNIETPEIYEPKVIRKGTPKVIIGKKGIYVLNDELAEKLIKEVWENYLKRYKKRGIKAKSSIVEPPVEVSEEELRAFLSKEGISPSISVGWINLCPEIPNFQVVAEKIKKVIEESKKELV